MLPRWKAAGSVTALALAALIQGCNPPELEPPAPASDSLRTTQQSTKIRVVETSLGRRKWVLEADEATSNETTGVSVLRSVRVTFYDEEGAVASTLTSNEGEAESKEHGGDEAQIGFDVRRRRDGLWRERLYGVEHEPEDHVVAVRDPEKEQHRAHRP